VGEHTVSKRFRFCYGHRIPGHAGPCRHLHGHSATVEVVCKGDLDELGMVVDFARIKELVEGWTLAHLDHRMVLMRGDPMVEVLEAQGEPVFVMDGSPTAENLAALLFSAARDAGLPVVRVRLWESETSMASYEGP
jgi:6-pyruvoyltetrahydropterin/6-carboxytetrahydropterin synthase